ncbi:helix-turn-helix domain-containing protein, partial [Bacteroides ovatus]
GISGFERAQTYDADLIICDVLMPGMTGFEVTKKLKNEFATSHIPIILLTALNMEEKYLEGIESGADAYITKPFSISLLLARISKLIEQRDKLREKFSNEPGMVHAAICTNNKDSKFLAKLNEMLNEHMVETEFSVDDYANLMGLGRTVFYKKVRGVTGYSPNEYLRVIRLKKAAELLLTEDLTVSEISYKVGINDPYYFSKCFKNQFGIAPSVYQKNGGKAPASNDTAENTEQASEEKEEENETDV